MTTRAVPFYCPYCGEEDLEPQGAATEVASNKEGILDISAVVQRGGILVLTPIDSGRPNRGSPDN